MITLAFSVLVYYFFSQVTQLSGFGGVNNVDLPGLVGDPGQDPPLYYTTLVVAVLVFLGLRYAARTPFGLGLQGLRDEPNRMRALGFNVTRHRILAFGLAAFVAAIAGVLSVWYNRRISPGSINLAQTIDVLIIAVSAGSTGSRARGSERSPTRCSTTTRASGRRRSGTSWARALQHDPRVVFLVIVLVSPGGLIGLWERGREFATRRRGHPRDPWRPRTRRTDLRKTCTTRGGRGESQDIAGADRRLLALGLVRPAAAMTTTTVATPMRAPSPRRRRGTIKVGFLSDCEGDFGSFFEPTASGFNQALIDKAGAKPASKKPSEGVTGATVAGKKIEIVGYGCADATADKAIEETRRLMEQEGADILVGPSPATRASRSPTTRRSTPTRRSSTASPERRTRR